MKNLKHVLAFAGILATALPSFAQHEHHTAPAKDTTSHEKHDMSGHEMKGHDMKNMDKSNDMQHSMTHNFSLSLPMNRNGSGTGWQPDATPMYAYMKHSDKWNYMLHGSLFLRYTGQNINNDGKKGSDSKLSFPNWVMGMAQRQVGKNGLLSFRAMVSLDRLTDGGAGYPLLLQSGESWKGQSLIDRQHPHDLISELSFGYTQRVSEKVDLTVYAGYPGEPALGPTAFMHRMSAFNNPDAVLGHHWQDATHITFGVVTAGVRYGKFKLEGSSFTGREPDENRFNFDKPRFDSYSYRLLFNPSKNWALQASRGFIKSPEVSDADKNIDRTTASVQHSANLNGENRWISSSLVWGLNKAGGHHKEHSLLLESNLQLNRWAVYGRYEWMQKSSHEVFASRPGGISENEIFPISAFTLGLNRQIVSFSNTLLQAGVQASLYGIDQTLKPFYGNSPLSGQVYLRLTPGRMRM
ncbi:hypothetical protein [Dyadobacter psychrotolerans]|uniref:Alginate export domain-containing protein n=1 Tax=Dyadobacter psychrotolerans TaxID=2541721 RepID=A0A4V6PFQ9_9BACT|nr:hypothetical protein [Dyadobacter psychrotolerans]TDE12908.1 hypothetical protein E0F88_21455 [Dyadobacter psychrotolerans]